MTTPTPHTPGMPQRPTRPALTRDYILRTALVLIDRDGASALSMRKLGAAMGVDAMAIYHHVPNKAALFDGVAEVLWSEISLDVSVNAPWTEHIATVMRTLRNALRAHPRAVPIVATRPITTPAMLTLIESCLGLLTPAGIDDLEALDLLNCLAAYTIGQVLGEVGETVGDEGPPLEETYAALTPDNYPHLAKVLAHGPDPRYDIRYEAGLTALIVGWDARPTRPASSTRKAVGRQKSLGKE